VVGSTVARAILVGSPVVGSSVTVVPYRPVAVTVRGRTVRDRRGSAVPSVAVPVVRWLGDGRVDAGPSKCGQYADGGGG